LNSVALFKTIFSTGEREIIDNISSNGVERKKGEQRLFNRYTYLIKEAIYKYSLTYEEAVDVYSDTILSAIGKIASNDFRGQSSLKTWVYSIYHHKYVDLVRKKTTNKNSVHRASAIPDALLQVSDESRTIIQQLISKADHEILRQKLLQIGTPCKELLLYWADGYADKEITELMKYKTADVVKTTRLRCLEKLKQLYTTR
jgi:RNA polymerase sigma factor (sigma-70 family)